MESIKTERKKNRRDQILISITITIIHRNRNHIRSYNRWGWVKTRMMIINYSRIFTRMEIGTIKTISWIIRVNVLSKSMEWISRSIYKTCHLNCSINQWEAVFICLIHSIAVHWRNTTMNRENGRSKTSKWLNNWEVGNMDKCFYVKI